MLHPSQQMPRHLEFYLLSPCYELYSSDAMMQTFIADESQIKTASVYKLNLKLSNMKGFTACYFPLWK